MAAATRPSVAVRGTAAWLLVCGVGFGITAVYAILYLRRHGELPMTPFGFRALEGPLARLDMDQVTAFGAALAGLSALDVLAGVWLWQGRRRGATLGLLTSPAALGLGIGFELPFLVLEVPFRVAILASRRPSLR